MRLITKYYQRAHYSTPSFTPELSDLVMKNFIKLWDPGKVYFLQKDVDLVMTKVAPKLKDLLESNNCSPIDLIFALYSKRFADQMNSITSQIGLKHDFNIDESLIIDRTKLKYAAEEKELKERWRKRIKFQHMQLLKSLDDEKVVREKLTKRYGLLKKRHDELNTDDVYSSFLDAFATALDPHTDYFPPVQLEEFQIQTRLSLDGIGAMLRSMDGITSVSSLVPGGAAAKGGLLKVDDKIVAVAQADGPPVDVIDMDIKDVVKHIRGPGGTKVILTVRRDGKELIIPIIREKVQLEDRAAKSMAYNIKVGADNFLIGVIDLPSFYIDFAGRQAKKKDFRSSSRDVAHELEKLNEKKIDGLIVDVRSNPGGSLDEAITLSGLFNGPGPVVQVKGNQGEAQVSEYQGPAMYNGPLIILVDRQSASASEILAGAIKDYERGLIVGDAHTFGKGTVQSLNDLDQRLGAIKITISKFYRPSGSSTQQKGVDSDIVFPSIADLYGIGEKHYDQSLPWEAVPAANYRNFNLVSRFLPEIKKRSMARINADSEFKKVYEAISEYEKNEEERSKVSLKLDPKEKQNSKESIDEKLATDTKKGEEKKKTEEEKKLEQLKHDPYLQETLKIAGDYILVQRSKKLANTIIVGLNK